MKFLPPFLFAVVLGAFLSSQGVERWVIILLNTLIISFYFYFIDKSRNRT